MLDKTVFTVLVFKHSVGRTRRFNIANKNPVTGYDPEPYPSISHCQNLYPYDPFPSNRPPIIPSVYQVDIFLLWCDFG